MLQASNKSKFLLLIVLLIVVCITAACSSNKEKENETASTPVPTPVNTDKKAEPEVQKPGGAISFLLINNGTPDFYSPAETEKNEYVKHLQKISGYELKYEFLPGAEAATQLALRFSSGDLPDVIRTTGINGPAHPGAVEQKAFLDLTDLIAKHAPTLKAAIPDSVWKSPQVSQDGRIYGIPAMLPYPDTQLIYYRKDWMKAAGMTEPKTLDDWLKFFEYVKNNDMNGNGDKTDEVGFAVRENMAYSELFFGSYGVNPYVWGMKDDKFIPTMITDEMKQAVGFWKTLYENGYVNENMFTNKGADWANMARTGTAAAWLHDAANYNSWSKDLNPDLANTDLIGYASAPVGPNGDAYLNQKRLGVYFVHVIPSNTKNVEEILRYFEWVYANKEAQEFFLYGIEGINFKKDGDKYLFEGVPKPVNTLDRTAEGAMFQLYLNPQGVGYEKAEVLAFSPVADVIMDGFAKASKHAFPDDSVNMPKFELLGQRPELATSTVTGTLFMDMFAKVITGAEPLDSEFNKFVAEWRKRGGDQLIEEATAWHKSFYAK